VNRKERRKEKGGKEKRGKEKGEGRKR